MKLKQKIKDYINWTSVLTLNQLFFIIIGISHSIINEFLLKQKLDWEELEKSHMHSW